MNVLLLYNTYSISSRIDLVWQPPPHHNRFTALFPGPPGWAGARRELLTLWCKGRLTEADTLTIRLGATPFGLTSAHLHHLPIIYRLDTLPVAQPTVSKYWRQLAYSDKGEDARVLVNGVTCTMSDSVWQIDSKRFFPSLVRALKWGTHSNCPVVKENHLQS